MHSKQGNYTLAASFPSYATITVTNGNMLDHMTGPLMLHNLFTDGVFVAPDLPSAATGRRIEFIGDSITAGSMMRRPEGDPAFGIPAGPTCADSGLYSDYLNSFVNLLCTAFSASCSTIARNGLGVYLDCCGDVGTKMPDYYPRVLAKVEDVYSFEDAPQAVVINLGTNDWSGCEDEDPFDDGCGPEFEAAFARHYVNFMLNITLWYASPGIKFFLAVGPIIGSYMNATEQAAALARRHGLDARMLDVMVCGPGGGCHGCNRHPNTREHREMFERMYAPMKVALGW